ncbi:MAG: type II toxin-antitoxin system ParD family antitoxin [Chloroflexi bacterium]|nr:type II toxin-antitoxin system ParD family antitoxin [Chloroflexota bacterium]
MNVSLTPQLEQYVKDKVKSGLYNSSSEVVREALRLMGERDMLRQIRVEELRGEIQKGIDQIERGEYVEGEDVFRLLKERNAEIRKKSE